MSISRILFVAGLLLVSQLVFTAEDDAKPYPLETCIVANSPLGSMGEPHVFVHEGQTIKMCCVGCMGAFNKDPAKYLAKLNPTKPKVKALPTAGESTASPHKTTNQACTVSGEDIDPDDHIALVREGNTYLFCCSGCMRRFTKNPTAFIQ